MPEVQVDASDSLTGETALTIAAMNGCHNVISSLLQRGASISTTNGKVLLLVLYYFCGLLCLLECQC